MCVYIHIGCYIILFKEVLVTRDANHRYCLQRLSLLLDKRATVDGDGQSAFPATQHHGQHSGAFNAIHVTAAVVGIVAAAAVGITVFVVCRRRMQKKSGDPASPSMKKQHCPSSPSSSKPRTVHVDLLASNYYGENVDRIPSSSLSSPPKTYNDMVSISPPPPPYRP